ncbi:MAG: hypothetical protein ACR2H2_00530 [Solirubrobacteraceae bacterium]
MRGPRPTEAYSRFAVDDLTQAQEFYGQTLGLKTSEAYGLLTLHLADGRDTLVYSKPDHTPADYTIRDGDNDESRHGNGDAPLR